MDLDELKKSWNTIDEHLKKQQLVNNANIEQLIRYASQNIHSMSRFNYWIRIVSLIILAGSVLYFICNHTVPSLLYLIIYFAAIPALTWDIYSSNYLTNTKVDEQPIAVVIERFNRMNRWMIRERLIGILFILVIAIVFFVARQMWNESVGMVIIFVADWLVCQIGRAHV